MPPVIGVTGRSNSGKTTLLVKLVDELSSRGYRVATVKDSHKEPAFDAKNKDSWRHIDAGSVSTALLTQSEIIIIRKRTPNHTLEGIVAMLGDNCDLVLAEGFKYSGIPKIEVHRRGHELINDLNNRIALATDEPLESVVPQFDINDPVSIADFIICETGIEEISRLVLKVNGEPVALKPFISDLIYNMVTGVTDCLKTGDKIETIEISARKEL